jgi:hypothetical protein
MKYARVSDMKTFFRLIMLLGACGLFPMNAALAQARPIHYAVAFKDQVVATQTVTIAQTDGLTTIETRFEAELPVFVARHTYAESLSATFREDGTVERFRSIRQDGAARTEVAGTWLPEESKLQIIRTDQQGTTIQTVARDQYDLHSLILYGTSPADFLPEHRPVRLLDIAEGQVVSCGIQTISESETTSERQHVASVHLIWTVGEFVSHSWHPERFSNLPSRYIRQTENGRFTFTLQR